MKDAKDEKDVNDEKSGFSENFILICLIGVVIFGSHKYFSDNA